MLSPKGHTSPTPHRIIAVIVLYGIAPDAAVSYRSLLVSLAATLPASVDLRILLHDNSPQANPPLELSDGVEYVHDPSNSGLALAYNRALSVCLDAEYDWLLTLDQDTGLPEDFLPKLTRVLDAIQDKFDIGAVLPQIHASGRVVSPNWFAAGAVPKWFPDEFRGVPEEHVFAFNSGSLVRVTALRQVGGYSPWFWLDNSDAWLFQKLHDYGKRVFVAGELKLQHDFSMLDMRNRVSATRYENILLSETAFWDLCRNRLAGAERTVRLAGRMAKHVKRGDPPELQRLTQKALLHRLFRSRAYRLKLWRSRTEARLGSASLLPWTGADATPAISVCMAAYGGERFIEAQIRSIVPQLGPRDEFVVVEDCSPDRTAAILERLRDELKREHGAPVLRLVRHAQNRGVVATFEDAVRNATGDILFLCDDDDLWAPDKVEKVMAAFRADAAVELVSTALRLIDDEDRAVEDESVLGRLNFNTSIARNLWINQFQGSAMAFRSSLVSRILPFPKDKLFLHDAWIGFRAILTGVRIAHIAEPLLLYRRHVNNYSKRFSRLSQVKLRLQLLYHLARKALSA